MRAILPTYGPPVDHSPLAREIYPQFVEPVYPVQSTARQIRRSLERQRAAGVPFAIAWKLAVGHVHLPHDSAERNIDRAVLEDPSVIALWSAAYDRRSHRAFAAVRAISAMLEAAEAEDARHRHEAA